MNKNLILIRGLPGSGKSTLAKIISDNYIEADQFFMEDGKYEFDSYKLKQAHQWCKNRTELWMKELNPLKTVVVSNTFTKEWEMKDYYQLAKKYGYKVHSIIVENRHNGESVHSVPDSIIKKMKNRFSVKLDKNENNKSFAINR